MKYMELQFIKSAFESSDKERIEDVSEKILQISDMSELKELSHHIDYFRQVIGDLETKETKLYCTNYKYIWPHLALKLLEGIVDGKCRCHQYLFQNCFPDDEQNKGFIKIINKPNKDGSKFSLITCECTLCGRMYTTEWVDSGFMPHLKKWCYLPEHFQ